MNSTKTNTYPKHYGISDDIIIISTIIPKPWHPVFATLVEKGLANGTPFNGMDNETLEGC